MKTEIIEQRISSISSKKHFHQVVVERRKLVCAGCLVVPAHHLDVQIALEGVMSAVRQCASCGPR